LQTTLFLAAQIVDNAKHQGEYAKILQIACCDVLAGTVEIGLK
jgi:hypothetical protein